MVTSSKHALALGVALGLGGCFHDQAMGPGGGGGRAEASSGEDTSLTTASTGEAPADSTSADVSTSGVEETTGGVADDESTASTGADEESSGSTGAAQDESTGSDPVLGVDELVPGDLVVTEMMSNPTCTGDACEWIEVFNATAFSVNLLDLYVQDIDESAGNQGRITADVIVAPGDVAVITRGVSLWPYPFTPDAVYGPNPGLNNNRPERVVLRNATQVLDRTPMFYAETAEGVAWSLSGDRLDATSNDDDANWCGSTIPLPAFATTEYGSPGVLNESC